MARPAVNVNEVLAAVASGKLSPDDAKELLTAPPANLSCKVSPKGALSVYGLGQWPTTLYRQQWERLFEFVPAMKQFIAENIGQLPDKQ